MQRKVLAADSYGRAARATRLVEQLSPRQKQILDRMVAGLLNKQIAFHLEIDETTVKMHRARVLKALQVTSSAGAIKIAVEASFIGAM